MQYLKPLITLGFWLDLAPAPLLPVAFRVLGSALAVFFAAGVVIKIIAHRARRNPPLHRILGRVGRAIITLALLGGLFYFCTYEQLYVFSARFWWILLLIGGVVWAVFIVRDIFTCYPVEVRARSAQLEKEKYFPK